MALVTTPAGSATNSFISLADANTWFTERYLSTDKWTALTDTEKENLLKISTKDISRFFNLKIIYSIFEDQALTWPWYGLEFAGSAETGSSDTEVIDDFFAWNIWDDDAKTFIGGVVFIAYAGDAAPQMERQIISAFAKATGKFTTAEFSAAVESGDSFLVIPANPQWLKDAVCEQANYTIRDAKTAIPQEIQAGIRNRSGDAAGGSVTYDKEQDGKWLSHEAYELILPYLPPELQVQELARA